MKVGILFLTILILLQSGGILLVCRLEQGLIKFSDKGNGKKIEYIVLSKKEYNKPRPDENEIVYNNTLYDITGIIESGNEITLSVINDDEEAEVIDMIKCLMNESSPSNPDQANTLFKFIKLVYSFSPFELNKFSLATLPPTYFNAKFSLVEFSCSTNTPPPQG